MERQGYDRGHRRTRQRRDGSSDHPDGNESRYYDRTRNPVEFSRLLNLSDGVFAIALTLLVLSLEIPPGLDTSDLYSELLNVTPMLVAFLVSVGIIALFWFSHYEIFAGVQKIDGRLMWVNFGYLSLVAMIPFVQRLQGDYPFEAVVYMVYASVLALLNMLDLWMHRHVYRAELLKKQWTPRQYRTEMLRGMTLVIGFLISIPLALVLLNWTIILWILLIPADNLVHRWRSCTA